MEKETGMCYSAEDVNEMASIMLKNQKERLLAEINQIGKEIFNKEITLEKIRELFN